MNKRRLARMLNRNRPQRSIEGANANKSPQEVSTQTGSETLAKQRSFEKRRFEDFRRRLMEAPYKPYYALYYRPPSKPSIYICCFYTKVYANYTPAIWIERDTQKPEAIHYSSILIKSSTLASPHYRVKHTKAQRWPRLALHHALTLIEDIGLPSDIGLRTVHKFGDLEALLSGQEKLRLAILSFYIQWEREQTPKDAKASDIQALPFLKTVSGSPLVTQIKRMGIERLAVRHE